MLRSVYSLVLVVIVSIISGCVRIPAGVGPITEFDVNRYVGTWYEIARLEHRFERGLTHVTAEYSFRDDDGIRVINQGYNPEDKRWKRAEGKAYFVGDRNVGRLKVSFFGPFYSSYNIISLDKNDYSYAMVTGPDKSYLWILARSPEPDQRIISKLISKADALGFNTGELIMVDHQSSVPPAKIEPGQSR